MNDQNIRLAASYALDRRTFHSAFLGNYGEKNTSPWTTAHWAYNPINDTAFEYDLDRARSYLEAAGYTDGKAADGTPALHQSRLPQGLSRSGSKVPKCSRRRWPSSASTSRSSSSSSRPGSSASSQPTNTISPGTSINRAPPIPPRPWRSPSSTRRDRRTSRRYEDEKLGDLIEQGGEELDQEKRKAIYDAFQERWNELQPGLIVGEFALFHVVAADVMGFATDPLMFQDFREVWLDR